MKRLQALLNGSSPAFRVLQKRVDRFSEGWSKVLTGILSLLQVMFGMWFVLPPSLWFVPGQFHTFALVSCLAIALSTVAAWAHNRVYNAVMGTLASKFNAALKAVK